MRDDDIILSCRVERTSAYEQGDDGRVTLLQPRFGFAPLQRLMVRWNRPYVRVRLDEVGSFIWLQCAGDSATVAAVVAALDTRFGDKLPSARARAVEFFRSLARSQLVRLHRPSDD